MNINIAKGSPRRRFTVANVEAMVRAGIIAEDERVELIQGELVPMSPKGSRHIMVHQALVDRWIRLCPSGIRLNVEATMRFGDDALLEPDIVIFTVDASGNAGAALLVVEVADTSLHFDLGQKAKLYAEFGAPEYWVIDAVKMTLHAFRNPSHEGYREKSDFKSTEIVEPALAPAVFSLKLADLELVKGVPRFAGPPKRE